MDGVDHDLTAPGPNLLAIRAAHPLDERRDWASFRYEEIRVEVQGHLAHLCRDCQDSSGLFSLEDRAAIRMAFTTVVEFDPAVVAVQTSTPRDAPPDGPHSFLRPPNLIDHPQHAPSLPQCRDNTIFRLLPPRLASDAVTWC